MARTYRLRRAEADSPGARFHQLQGGRGRTVSLPSHRDRDAGAKPSRRPLAGARAERAIEIADAPEARDTQGVEAVFRRLNGIVDRVRLPASLETEAALDIEQAVRREVPASPERTTSGPRSGAIEDVSLKALEASSITKS
jgi:hypothetical protein